MSGGRRRASSWERLVLFALSLGASSRPPGNHGCWTSSKIAVAGKHGGGGGTARGITAWTLRPSKDSDPSPPPPPLRWFLPVVCIT